MLAGPAGLKTEVDRLNVALRRLKEWVEQESGTTSTATDAAFSDVVEGCGERDLL